VESRNAELASESGVNGSFIQSRRRLPTTHRECGPACLSGSPLGPGAAAVAVAAGHTGQARGLGRAAAGRLSARVATRHSKTRQALLPYIPRRDRFRRQELFVLTAAARRARASSVHPAGPALNGHVPTSRLAPGRPPGRGCAACVPACLPCARLQRRAGGARQGSLNPCEGPRIM
jgi:hypothetical protein